MDDPFFALVTDDGWPIGLRARAVRAEREAPNDDPPVIAERVVARLSAREVRDLARRLVAIDVADARRRRVLSVEREAARECERAQQQQERNAAARKQQADEDDRAALFADPMLAYGEQHHRAGGLLINARRRKRWRSWCGEDGFADWTRRAVEAFAERGEDAWLDSRFGADWHPKGMRAFTMERLADDVADAMRRYVAEVRLELTAELLDSSFALGDGRRVTWGSATVVDHQQRIELLMGNATGNIETAGRHQAAIEMINAQDASTLSECPGAADRSNHEAAHERRPPSG